MGNTSLKAHNVAKYDPYSLTHPNDAPRTKTQVNAYAIRARGVLRQVDRDAKALEKQLATLGRARQQLLSCISRCVNYVEDRYVETDGDDSGA